MARILLLDDEKVARTLYGDYLRLDGHTVREVETVVDAKLALTEESFDAVITDLLLPQGDGMEVLQHIKVEYPGVEVIVITALDRVDPAVRAIKSGAAEYLVKPVPAEVLNHAVARALTARQLLRENEELRQHVALLETGQRIATTLDRERLLTTALAAFVQTTQAHAVLLYVRDSRNEYRLESSEGIEEADFEKFGQSLGVKLAELALTHPERPDLAASSPLSLDDLENIPTRFANVLAVPAVDVGSTFGYAILCFEGELPAVCAPAASYLARHLGLALHNLGRFAEVEDLAYLDDLTHLFNLRYLQLVLDREVKNAQQLNKLFSVLFLDLDYFKSVNDSHGHVVGSKLLMEIARIVKNCVRDNDVVCRYGGDEYVVLLRGTDSGGALKVGERIRRTIEAHHFLAREGFGLSMTTCIGVASFPEHAQDKDMLLDFADRAMYRGKKGTRNVIYLAAKGLEATPVQRHSLGSGQPL